MITARVLLSCCVIIACSDARRMEAEEKGPGEPLFLTPYIEEGRIEEARRAARVKAYAAGVESYAGLLTVNKRFDSNLFFWFFPSSRADWKGAPVAVWLQGGPGASSLYGLFNENGPYTIGEGGRIGTRRYSWHRKCNMVYIDSPVGTGYSFTRSEEGYARNQTDVGRDLHEAFVQFFKMFPRLRDNPFYIAGESYAGKFVPAFAYAVHQRNHASDVRINLQGLFIGNGLTDPENMIPLYGDVLYGLGFIDDNERVEFERRQAETVAAIRRRDWDSATLLYSQLIIGYSQFFAHPTYYANTTGLKTYYNYVDEASARWMPYESAFVTSDDFRRAIHVGGMPRDAGRLAQKLLRRDIAQSVVGWVAELVEHYRIMFYNGQLDVICAYPLTENFLRKMRWSGADAYRRAERSLWRVDGQHAGYIKRAGRLSDALVRNAGHMVPSDQPKWAYQLFNDFIYDRRT